MRRSFRTRWPRAASAIAALIALLLFRPLVHAAEPASLWTMVRPEQAVGADVPVRETAWTTTRPPAGPFDRIGLHRYRGQGHPFATLLYLPGKHMNGEAALKDERHNLWLHLAARGVEVYTLDYRTHAVPSDAPPSDLSSLQHWNTDAFVGDIRAAAAEARRLSGRTRLFVAGYSRGVSLGFAYLGAEADHVAGFIALDGGFKDPAGTNRYDAAQALRQAASNQAWTVDVGGSRGFAARREILTNAAAARTATPAEAAASNDALIALVQTAWGDGGLANPRGGMSKPWVLGALLAGNDRYYPVAQDIDARSVADHADDPRTPLDDRWGRLNVPMLVFVSTGLGARWVASAVHSIAASGSRDVHRHFLRGYGHLDVLVGEQASQDVFAPTLDWLRARAPLAHRARR